MSTTSPAVEVSESITAGILAVDHHSHAAYVRPGEASDGIESAEREAVAAVVESRMPHDAYLRYVEARRTGDQAGLVELEREHRVEDMHRQGIAEQQHTVYFRSLYAGARELHGNHDVAALRRLSRERNQLDPVGLYDEALRVSGTDFVLTDVPSIDHEIWPSSRYKQIVRIDPYLFPFGHPTFTRRGSDTPRFRRVFTQTLETLLAEASLDLSATSFLDYREFVRHSIRDRRRRGAVGLKIAAAYVRSLAFIERTPEEAEAAYTRMQAQAVVDPADHRVLADYLVYDIVELAQSEGLPVQIHVGHGHSEPGLLVSEANPLHLEMLLSTPRLNRARIILIHGGFPYGSYLTVLAQTYGNVHVDFSWMPILHHRVLDRTLEEWFEHLPANKFMYGTDTGSPEFHLAATQGARGAIDRVLLGGVRDRLWTRGSGG